MISAIGEFILFFIFAVTVLVLLSIARWRVYRRHITLRKHGRRRGP
jgi:hypothetical protein